MFGTLATKSFLEINRARFNGDDSYDDRQRNPYIGFKYANYAVSEGAGTVTIVVEKRIEEDISFWV